MLAARLTSMKTEHGQARRACIINGRESPVLLVGEQNPHSDDPRYALYHRPPSAAGARLRALLGLPVEEYLACWRVNLVDERAGWDKRAASDRALSLLSDPEPPWRTVVLLGRRVADACRYVGPFFSVDRARVDVDEGFEYLAMNWDNDGAFQARQPGEVAVVSLPHPSGRSREWNHRDARATTLSLLRQVEPDVAWGAEL